MENEYQEINLKEILFEWINKWWIVALFTITGLILSYYITSNHITPTYQASTILFIGKEGSGNGIGLSLNDLYINDQLFVDYQQLADTRLVINEVQKNLNISIPLEEFKRSMDVYSIEKSRLFGVSYTSIDPKLSADISNEMAKQLSVAASKIVNVENIVIIDKAIIPTEPMTPNLMLNTIVAGFLGFILSTILIIIKVLLDNTIKKEEDIEKIINVPVIGLIPKLRGEGKK